MELEFNLPEEYDDALLAFKGKDLWCVLFDLDQHLRAEIKYGEHEDRIGDIYESIRDYLHDLMAEHDCSIDMVS
jgi:hypothetical protein